MPRSLNVKDLSVQMIQCECTFSRY